MITELHTWFISKNIGDYSSIIGLLVSITGFLITIHNVRKTKDATDAAKYAVENVRKDLELFDSVVSLTTAIAAMDEIKRLQRMNAWAILPDRYSSLRKSLITIRGTNPDLSEDEQKLFQGAISQFSTLEKTIEESLPDSSESLESAKINGLVSKQIDKIQEILIYHKKKIGRDHNGI